MSSINYKLSFSRCFQVIGWCYLLCVLNLSDSFAQQKQPEEIYNDNGYKAAIQLLKDKEQLNQEDLEKIANSYRLNHDVVNAELWYAQVIKNSSNPVHFLYYAQALHSNEKYDLAKKYYQQYQDKIGTEGKDQRGSHLHDAIAQIHQFNHTEVQLINETKINTSKLEFSPAFYQNGIVFVSTVDPKKRKKNKRIKEENEALDLWINDNYMTLYFAAKSTSDSLETPVVFSSNLSTKFHEGPVTFDRNEEKIFFSRNQYLRGKKRTDKKGILKMNIYSAIKINDQWVEEKEMPWNTQEYEEVHPSLSADGQRLYFASNRPGGFGGMDLYYSDFQSGSWSDPVNLGATINTPGNEIFPFVHPDGRLYFASDGWGGLGGLDIFHTLLTIENKWQKVQNMGTPFNSSKDDFGFILNKENTVGYLSSAREGGRGKDDIYSFNLKNKNQLKDSKINMTVCVYDELNNQRIEGVELHFMKQEKTTDDNQPNDFTMRLVKTEIDNEYLLKLSQKASKINPDAWQKITDENGAVKVSVSAEDDYLIIAKKGGYEIAQYPFKSSMLGNNKISEYCLPLTKKQCVSLEGLALNEKYRSKIPNTQITLVNLCSGEEQKTTSDLNGFFSFPCLPCGCEFLLIGNKDYFKTAKLDINTIQTDCNTTAVIKKDLLFTLGKNKTEATTSTTSKQTNLNVPIQLSVGNTIELKNIYYDFDQYYIRKGSYESLEWLVQLMKKYPSLSFELSAHTDARGKSNYNQWLSRKRAKAAANYIISRGISPYRLKAKGYGESQIRNHCTNGVDCSEAEHQYNRRTEVKVLSFDRTDVSVRYLDNDPVKIDAAPLGKRKD
jgi:outer membrane protein OmpA-like peptidoglycan-associated protein